ncbi:KOW domain-containing RNA-binding protein [Murdochiella vaginalis]|uniref:KOW domain-containing RNA-binding protein n=1 Tax=Murdochiella vaginalis TaxID=1852373 RepID=UPI0009F4EDBE|nr:KOW domain-containing RNA-binding protein [Murdochiella vaginalis]
MTLEANMDQPCPYVPGQVVRSKAGHDKGKVFLVLDRCDAKHVHVVDGRTRTLAHPKKKRVIHLQPYRAIVSDLQTMKGDAALDDATIRKWLAPYREAQTKEES